MNITKQVESMSPDAQAAEIARLQERIASLEAQVQHLAMGYRDVGFEARLKQLTEITRHLDQAADTDEVCRLTVQYGVEHLGFERLGLWLLSEDGKLMRGTYGVDEQGKLRDERGRAFRAGSLFMQRFGKDGRQPYVDLDAELMNDTSQVVGRGWHISVPMTDGDQYVGFLSADNLLSRAPMLPYQPELLRLYATTAGYLVAKKREQARAQGQEIALLLEKERIAMLHQFMASLAHDFKTPLAIINTRAYIIQRLSNDTRVQENLGHIIHQSRLINHLLDDMLMFMRLETEDTLNKRSVQLTEVLQQAVDTMNTLAEQRQQHIQLRLQGNITLMADPSWLLQAFCELIENALLFSPEGSEVRVICQQDGAKLYIHIEDNGIGIDEEEQARVFEPFYRVDKARQRRATGLGLSLVKRIVEHHGATLHLTSTLGQGTRVTLTFTL